MTMRRVLLVLLVASSFAVTAGCDPSPICDYTSFGCNHQPQGPGLRMSIVYGDSMTSQAKSLIHATIVRAEGGEAVCDWFTQMRQDATLHPSVVVLALNGNWWANSCVTSRIVGFNPANDPTHGGPKLYGAQLTRIYLDDLHTAAGFFGPDTKVYGVLPAPLRHDDRSWSVDAYRQSGLPLIDVRSLFVDSEGKYQAVLPCLPGECVGSVTVRASDGSHFYDGKASPELAAQSAGAHRYADALNSVL